MTDGVDREVLHIIAQMVVELTKLRQQECKHLVIENFSPELYDSLIEVAKKHGLFRGEFKHE